MFPGLFHKAVLMGLYISNPTIVLLKDNVTPAFELAKSLGYEGDDANDRKKLLAFYKKIDIDTIITLKPESFLHEVRKSILSEAKVSYSFTI